MGNRCATRSYLRLVSSDRPWTGKPSTTQLISGTMYAFLKIIKDYSVSPDDRSFMITGSKGHGVLEGSEDNLSLLEEKFSGEDTEITGIADVIEIECGRSVLVDYKLSGSYKIAKALGMFVDQEPSGEVYKSGPRKGTEKMRKVLKRSPDKEDRWEWELQLNKYRMEFEKRWGKKLDELRIQCIARDGGTFIARTRGVYRKVYYFQIAILPDSQINGYFSRKRTDLLKALDDYKKNGAMWKYPCNEKENWGGLRCASYCEVAEYCPLGKLVKKEKENEDMAIKGVSEIRRLPRLGKLRLGIKVMNKSGKEYPKEVDYFVIDPQTPSELENKKIADEFHKLYGEQPKQIKIMIPVSDVNVTFPQFYKRYGSGTSLQCRGDGEKAVLTQPEFGKDLEKLGKSEFGLDEVVCNGQECPYFQKNKCARVGTLNVILPDIPGAGVWQITTGSFNSIVNVNSCLDYIKAVAGRCHMIPLTLERREQEIPHEGKKTRHYIIHINMDVKLSELQRYAQISPEKMALELPPPEKEYEDIHFQKNEVVDTKALPESQAPKEDFVKERTLYAKAEIGIGKDDCLKILSDKGYENIDQITDKKAWDEVLELLRKKYLSKKDDTVVPPPTEDPI